MIKDAYVQYQSRKAAKDLFDAMELLPGRVKMERDVHYIDDKTAAMNLHLVLMMAALEDGAYDRAVELAERRGEITSMAWHLLESGGADQYRNRLIELTRLQEHLTELAAQAQEVVRASLQRSRLEKQRMRGYHQAVGQALQ